MTDDISELSELETGDELHITIEGDKTLPLSVGGTDKRTVWLHYEGDEYAKMSESSVTNDQYDWTLMTLYSGDDEIVGVENIKVV